MFRLFQASVLFLSQSALCLSLSRRSLETASGGTRLVVRGKGRGSCFLTIPGPLKPIASLYPFACPLGLCAGGRPLSSSALNSAPLLAMSSGTQGGVSFLTQQEAQHVDEVLMGDEVGFKVEQLMELAGLSVSHAVYKAYPPGSFRRVLIVCGPGNNGGDGLVAARHLWQFGYTVEVLYPKPPKKDLYVQLLQLLKFHDIKVHSECPSAAELREACDLVVDAIFGFSFQGEMREPFGSIVKTLNESQRPVVAVDIPSGWDLEKGDVSGLGIKAECLVSLTAPKKAASLFSGGGGHWVGGRFVPPHVASRLGLKLPAYPGCEQVVRLS